MAATISRERALQELDDAANYRADELFLSGAGLDTNLSPSDVAQILHDYVEGRMKRALTKNAMKALLDGAVTAAVEACRKDVQRIADDVLSQII